MRQTVEFLKEHVSTTPRVGLVLGSGLGALAEQISDAVRIRFADIPGFHASDVQGHKGFLVAGRLEGVDCIAMQGRFHLYEGHSAATAALPVRVMAALGAHTLVISNAAGAINPTLRAGQLMIIQDHINFMFRSPLIGAVVEGDARFPDMSEPYDRELQQIAEAVAREQQIELAHGVYIAVLGPSYETPAEIAMFRKFGADVVGMSTVPEVIAARAMGVRVLGISLVTNAAAGIGTQALTHDEVIEAGHEAAPRFAALVRGVIKKLG
ncbi:MAG TPA: purine-nucleoside phosphorylase [Longimicrobiales bacterium]